MSRPLCIYHGNCADGFGAAWAVRRFFGADGVDFHAGVYQNAPPDVAGRHVILVDFSYKRDVMFAMAQNAEGVLVLDHHKSAAEDLRDGGLRITDLREYMGAVTWERFLNNCAQDRCEGIPYGRIYRYFDLQKSGAGLAWDFFFPNEPRPALINHLEDRDLWRFALPYTREIQAAVFSYPYDFDTWSELMLTPLEDLADEGEAIERKHHKDVAELIGVVTRPMQIAGHVVPIANLPYTLTSDAGDKLASGHPFAGCYWDTPEGRVFSLRSTDDGLDVAEIARQYGGGGHRNASGFRVSFDQARAFEVSP